MDRAYSLLEIKAVDAATRVIEGIASTPTPDRGGDVMEPAGAEFTLPMPFLWEHDLPIGEVFAADVRPDGIYIKAKMSALAPDAPQSLKDRIDEAWHSISARPPLARGLSIGWKGLQSAPIKGTSFIRYLKWIWAETSAVVVPMNTEATILAVKQLDLAASGRHTPGDTGSLPVVRAVKAAPAMANTVREQITAFENTRAAKAARMNELMTKAAETGVTLDQAQTEEYDTLALEVKSVDSHLTRLNDLEKQNLAAATPLSGSVLDIKTASEIRGGQPVISVKSNVPKGTAFTRFVMAKVAGQGSLSDAIRIVEQRKDWMDETPEVLLMLKAVVNPGTIAEPAWAAPLAVTQPINEFLELLRPATIIGKIPGLRKVPFNISMPVQTGGGTYGWVGEGAPKPVGNLQFTSATLAIAKAAGIIVISQELAKISTPSAEAVVRNDMIKGMAAYLDQQFIDPTVAAVASVSPASITNAAVQVGSAGSSPDNAKTDLKALVSSLLTANQGQGGIAQATFILSEANAFALATAVNPLGEPLFPGMDATGGKLLTLNAVASQSAGSTVAVILPSDILFADDGGVNIDVSREASLEMNTAPTSPVTASTVTVSLWQQNLVGLRAERFINWKRVSRPTAQAVVYTTATYV